MKPNLPIIKVTHGTTLPCALLSTSTTVVRRHPRVPRWYVILLVNQAPELLPGGVEVGQSQAVDEEVCPPHQTSAHHGA